MDYAQLTAVTHICLQDLLHHRDNIVCVGFVPLRQLKCTHATSIGPEISTFHRLYFPPPVKIICDPLAIVVVHPFVCMCNFE